MCPAMIICGGKIKNWKTNYFHVPLFYSDFDEPFPKQSNHFIHIFFDMLTDSWVENNITYKKYRYLTEWLMSLVSGIDIAIADD